MKKLLLLAISCFVCVSFVLAQEPAICGDWIGVYKGFKMSDDVDEDGDHYPVQTDYKAYLRIKIIDNRYTVRMKTRIADESKPFNYEPECRIENANENSITWVFDHGDDYDWSPSAKEQGIRIGHSHSVTRCWVVLINGVLKYTDLYITTYYDKQGRIITTKQWDIPSMRKSYNLYKDDKDW